LRHAKELFILEKFRLSIVDIIDERPNTKTYILEKPENLTWEEGSHIHLALEDYDKDEIPNKALVRHMSIMSNWDENKLAFTTRFAEPLSPFKEGLAHLTKGNHLKVFKVNSRMSLRREGRPLVLISMGVGLATMRPLLHRFHQESNLIPSVISLNVDAHAAHEKALYQDELEGLKNKQINLIWCKSRLELFNALESLQIEKAIYYVVGSDLFLRTILKRLKAKGVSKDAIVIDKKSHMLDLYYEF
jgi:ferredoxin--NADP+ reductase